MCGEPSNAFEQLLARGNTQDETVSPLYSATGSRAAVIERLTQLMGRYQTMVEQNPDGPVTHIGEEGESRSRVIAYLQQLGYHFPDDPLADAAPQPTHPDVAPIENETLENYQQFMIDGKSLYQWWQVAAYNNQLDSASGGDQHQQHVHPTARVTPTDSFTSLRQRLLCTVASLSNLDAIRMFSLLTGTNPIAAALLQIPLSINERKLPTPGATRSAETEEVVS